MISRISTRVTRYPIGSGHMTDAVRLIQSAFSCTLEFTHVNFRLDSN